MEPFRKLVEEVLNNKALVGDLGFNFLTKEWYQENNVVFPLTFIDSLQQKLRKY